MCFEELDLVVAKIDDVGRDWIMGLQDNVLYLQSTFLKRQCRCNMIW